MLCTHQRLKKLKKVWDYVMEKKTKFKDLKDLLLLDYILQ
jgi:hypothetical protein